MERFFIKFSLIYFLIICTTACQPWTGLSNQLTPTPSPVVSILGHREYTIHQRLALVNEGPGEPEKQNLWVALIQSFPPYQEVLSLEIAPKGYTLFTDEYGNQYAEFDFSEHPAGTTKEVQIDYQLIVNELSYDLSNCEGELPDVFTQPELHIESDNPQIVTLANELSQGKKTSCQQIRAFYDYIGNELVYSNNQDSWGAQATLGFMGSDCTEFTALLIALSRAQGIPARYFEGLRYLKEGVEPTAGNEHAWADVYLPGIGWVPADPTLGRSAIDRETYFAHYTPEHIIITMGVNPSTLRGGHYWTHLYWPGNSTKIHIEAAKWEIDAIEQ